jgi:hypothetical protein
MKIIGVVLLLLMLYLAVLIPFTSYLKNKPYVEKLGYVPKGEVLNYVSADQKGFIAATLVMKVLMYFGSLSEKSFSKISIPPDYPAMSRTIHAAVKLDPYNMDAYYFAQAILAWDVKQIQLANELLEYGMRYRNWDFMLPMFAGFNNAYFLKDYTKAARYYRMAGDLSGSDLFIRLAGRYMYESGKSEMAIAYLTAMEKGARNEAIKKSFQTRIQAFKAARLIELARDTYAKETGHLPQSLHQLIIKGYLEKIPADPYGGEFYLEQNGTVQSSSKFASGIRTEK